MRYAATFALLLFAGSVYVEMMCNLLGPILTSHSSSSSAAATKAQSATAAANSSTAGSGQTGTLERGRFTGSIIGRRRDELPDEPPPSRNQVLVRYDVVFDLPHDTSAFIGRAAHCATMEHEIFLHKLMLVTLSKYFV